MPSSGGVRRPSAARPNTRDLTRVEPHAAGDGANQRGLPGAVRAEQRQQLALAQLQGRAVERFHGAERLSGVDD